MRLGDLPLLLSFTSLLSLCAALVYDCTKDADITNIPETPEICTLIKGKPPFPKDYNEPPWSAVWSGPVGKDIRKRQQNPVRVSIEANTTTQVLRVDITPLQHGLDFMVRMKNSDEVKSVSLFASKTPWSTYAAWNARVLYYQTLYRELNRAMAPFNRDGQDAAFSEERYGYTYEIKLSEDRETMQRALNSATAVVGTILKEIKNVLSVHLDSTL